MEIQLLQRYTSVELGDTSEGPQPIYGFGLALADLDGDGWLDLVAARPRPRSVALRNDGAGALVFTDAFSVDGGPFPPATSLALTDLDGDRDVDLFLGRPDGSPDLLLYNDGHGRFSSVPLPQSLPFAMSATFVDVDLDGDSDLFVARSIGTFSETVIQEIESGILTGPPNSLYYNQEGRFVDVSQRLPSGDTTAFSFVGTFVDLDGDQRLERYLANDFGIYGQGNRMHQVAADGSFHAVDGCGCELEFFSMSAVLGDVNGDLLADLFVTNIGPVALLVGAGDLSFYDAAAAMGVGLVGQAERLVSWGAELADLDLDGWEDLAVTFGPIPGSYVTDSGGSVVEMEAEQLDALLMNREGLGFEERSEELGFNDAGSNRSIVQGDLDRDGRPDLVVAGQTSLSIYRTAGGCGRGITLRLDDGGFNRLGLGAIVDVTVADHTYRRWMLPETTLSTSAPELYLGLGRSRRAERIEVIWPDGGRSKRMDVEAGAEIELRR